MKKWRKLVSLVRKGRSCWGISFVREKLRHTRRSRVRSCSKRKIAVWLNPNARVVLAALRSALALHRLDYPADLGRITFGTNVFEAFGSTFSVGSTGEDLHRWATQLEGAVCDAIDSFGGSDLKSLPGSETFSALSLLHRESLMIDKKPVAERVLLLDDVHHLTHRQRSRVLKVVAELRAGVGIWLAERFEALSSDEMLSSGMSEGRDYEGEILLAQRFWRAPPQV